MTSKIVDCLRLFNRKERYWLIRNAIGEKDQDLPLSSSFRERLGKVIETEIPADAWWALDYHIDWLFAALVLFSVPRESETKPIKNPEMFSKNEKLRRLVRGTQEDFDFIVAFGQTIVLIEAKGVGSWTNKQISSKHQRLSEWKQFSECLHPGVGSMTEKLRVIVVLMSPKESAGLHQRDWPTFINDGGNSPKFLKMDFSGAPENFYVPERCIVRDEKPIPAFDGDCWHLKSVARPDNSES